MARNKLIRVFLLCLTVFFMPLMFSGCWDSKDINEKLVIISTIFDYKDGEIWYYCEAANIAATSKNASRSGENEQFIIYSAHGKTMYDVAGSLDTKANKPLFFSSLDTIIQTERFAEKFLIESFYRYMTLYETRKKVTVVITQEEPEEIFGTAHGIGVSAGVYIEDLLATLDKEGKSFSRMTSRIIENLSSKYSGILIPCIGSREGNLSLIGYSVVSGSRLNGFIPIEETRGLVLLKTKRSEFQYKLKYKDIDFTINVILRKRKIKANYKDNKVCFGLEFDFDAELMYGDTKIPYGLNEYDHTEMSEMLEDIIEGKISEAIERAKNEFETDYLQFDDEFRIRYPEVFDSMDWQAEFKDADIALDVNVKMKNLLGLEFGVDFVR